MVVSIWPEAVFVLDFDELLLLSFELNTQHRKSRKDFLVYKYSIV